MYSGEMTKKKICLPSCMAFAHTKVGKLIVKLFLFSIFITWPVLLKTVLMKCSPVPIT